MSDEVTPEFDTIVFDNGDYYEGEVINRTPHGQGTMFYISGVTLTSYWLYGLPITRKEPDTKIPGYDDDNYQRDVIIDGYTFCVGYGYYNNDISTAFGISKFIRGIRIHHDKAVLYSIENSVYRDGYGWEKDDDGEYIFVYTGEGLEGDQNMDRGNFFLKNSNDKGLYLFVRRRSNDYVFNGIVGVKRVEEAIEPDKYGKNRKVFKFILRRL